MDFGIGTFANKLEESELAIEVPADCKGLQVAIPLFNCFPVGIIKNEALLILEYFKRMVYIAINNMCVIPNLDPDEVHIQFEQSIGFPIADARNQNQFVVCENKIGF